MDLPKHIHIVGICGVATSAIAIALNKRGVKITGSDKGFYPPVSTYLTEAGIEYYAGWHPENFTKTGKPDLVMVGGSGTSPSNPEIVFATEHSIPVKPFAEVLHDYFIRKNSIVIAGTWGKTTISSLLSFIFIEAGLDPSYFSGGLSLSHPTGALTDSDWSIVEGDEYQVSISDKRPKFACYSPTHLVLTSISWDHADLYPTEKDYFDAFKKLLTDTPDNGKILACTDDTGVRTLIANIDKKTLSYGKNESADYRYDSVALSKEGISFSIRYGDDVFKISSPMIGSFNAENITAAFVMAHIAGIESDKIIKAIKDFEGIRRRFEKRFECEVTIFDCHAPTPEKALSALSELDQIYSGKIIAIFEPNIGGRSRETTSKYNNAFKNADSVIIPRLSKLKISEDEKNFPLEGEELASIISRTHPNVKYIDDDRSLVDYLIATKENGDVIVFLGSHGFRGMIEETVGRISKS